MEKWLSGFASSYGGKLSIPRSSSWRGTTDLTFSKYQLVIPVANRSLEIEFLYREAYGRLGDHYQIRATMPVGLLGIKRVSITKKSWWHIFYKSKVKTGIKSFDTTYAVRGDEAIAHKILDTERTVNTFIQASPVGLFIHTKKDRSAKLYGVYRHMPKEELEAAVHIFYHLDTLF
ncbi:hypothetical protein AB9P05_20160 [Roseivirga sp. BDSF3-8]|uniref:hypothetical protein n=1 Tax=Roseivirga sp. BDSF3-8 TaxID=3241598 RepID=UPI003531AA05